MGDQQPPQVANKLNQMIDRWLPIALRGDDPTAANIVLRAMELQARILGLVS